MLHDYHHVVRKVNGKMNEWKSQQLDQRANKAQGRHVEYILQYLFYWYWNAIFNSLPFPNIVDKIPNDIEWYSLGLFRHKQQLFLSSENLSFVKSSAASYAHRQIFQHQTNHDATALPRVLIKKEAAINYN